MITGDHPGTARAVAQQVGISGDGELATTGAELDALSDAKWSLWSRRSPCSPG